MASIPIGFNSSQILVQAAASCDGILKAYEDLIAAHLSAAAVICYSGHGGRAAKPSWSPGANTPQYLQFLVSADFETADGRFYGIFAFEVSALLARLTTAGRNVTIILDWSHAAMWGSTGVRVDALVVTGPSKGDAPYTPATFNFPRISAGDSLPFDYLLLFAGEPVRFLDFQLWVSKAKSDSIPLGELIRDTVNDPEFKAALAVLEAVPVAASLVGAGAAAGTIGYFADNVLHAAVDDAIGLYRTSFLLDQNYGLGSRPKLGLIRAQDFSFSYDIAGL